MYMYIKLLVIYKFFCFFLLLLKVFFLETCAMCLFWVLLTNMLSMYSYVYVYLNFSYIVLVLLANMLYMYSYVYVY